MAEALVSYLAAQLRLPDAAVAGIAARFRPRRTARDEVVLPPGQVCQHVYFVAAGCLRAFYTQPESGQEATRYVAFDGQFGTALSSLLTQTPSLETLQTVEPSELWALPYADFQELLASVPAWETFYRQQLERAYLINTWRLESLLAMTARERFEHLFQTNPEVIRRLSNKLTASYLGITPESLSRLKRRRR